MDVSESTKKKFKLDRGNINT